MSTKGKAYTLRFPDCPSGLDRFNALKRLHRETYPQHGLSFNQWCVRRLSVGQNIGDQVFSAFESLCQAADSLTDQPSETRAASALVDQALSQLLAVIHDLEGQGYRATDTHDERLAS